MSISLKNKILFPYLVLASSITGIAQNSPEVLLAPITNKIDNLASKEVSSSNGAITKYNIDYKSVEKTSENKNSDFSSNGNISEILNFTQSPSFDINNPNSINRFGLGLNLASINYQVMDKNIGAHSFSFTQHAQYIHLMNIDSQISDELKYLDAGMNAQLGIIRNKQELYFYSILFMLIQIGLAYSVGFFIHYKSQKTIEQRSSYLRRIYRFKACFNSGCCAYWTNQTYLSCKETSLTKLKTIKLLSKELLMKLDLALFVANHKTITTH